MVKIDPRGKKDIIAVMKERAKSYTPEWDPDFREPDIAASLAIACAEMFEGTIKKINGLPLKNRIAFYNMLGASLLPGIPSEGFVSFALSSDDALSAEVPKGTVLSSYGGDGEPVHFETTDDVLAVSAKIGACFCVDDKDDHIGRYEDITKKRTALFSLPETNLQAHTLFTSHPYAFDLRSASELGISFFHKGGVPLHSDDIRMFTSESVSVEYYAGERGFIPFDGIKERNGRLILTKGEKQPPVSRDENGCQIRVSVRDISLFRSFRFVYSEAFPSGRHILSDCITNGLTELEINAFFPFGERFQIFNEVYFGCGEVLDKKGALVTMNFDLSFLEIPIENPLPDEGIKWKWIAKKSDFKERASYKITISEVIWEYYNGSGWSRLYPDKTHSDTFNYTEGVTCCYRSITFVCPEDIEPAFVGAREDHYIRARILKAENLYKLNGFFMSPFIRNLSFDYHYEGEGCRIRDMKAFNCLEERIYDDRSGENFRPFYGTETESRMVYLGFTKPPENGPLRILWDVREDPLSESSELLWQYLGSGGWKAMNMVDETNGFTTVGVTIFLDNHDFVRKRIFGEELYWVRIADMGNLYRRGDLRCPVISSVYINAVRAQNVDSHKEEYFAMNVYTEFAEFSLSSGGILDIEVWVNEFLTITETETDRLDKEGRVIRVRDDSGIVREIWVKWLEADTFVEADNTSRFFVADRGRGSIKFGNGRNGRIPAASDTDNIRVVYTTGGGVRSNAAPGEVNGMERSIGFVSSVTNPKRFYGGCDRETVYDALERSAVMLRTQGRVITARDLEELSFFASRSIEKVKVFSGRNITGAPEQGVVTLVVLRSPETEFSRVRNELNEFLLPRIAGSLVSSDGLYITEPEFIRIDIKAELVSDSLTGIFELKRSVDRCLRECIDSYSEKKGSREWELNRIPNEHQIRSAVLRLEHISYIKRIHITAYTDGAGGLKEIDTEDISKLPYFLPVSGDNDISIVSG